MLANEQRIDCVNRFVELANAMHQQEQISTAVVSSALMTACAIYATYSVTGNDGALKDSGIEKITRLFGEELSQVQRAKIERARSEGKDVAQSS